MPTALGLLTHALLRHMHAPKPAQGPANGPAGGAGAPAPVWPAGLQGDGFEAPTSARDLLQQVKERVEVRQTARTLNQGTEEGVQAPVVLGGTLPPIDQQDPDGRGLYRNGSMNCGPTAMAMIARADPDATINGVPVSQMSDTQLVMALKRAGGTTSDGTSPNGEIAMAEALGYQTKSSTGALDPKFVDRTLARGGSVIINGAIPIEGDIAGHYMVISGKDIQGNYIVNDPWTGQTLTMTPEAVNEYLTSNPTYGGWSIAVW